jgi:uncharacterized membrane protein YhaH (DUF805 family)
MLALGVAMSLGSFLFGFNGRIGRKQLWLFLLLYIPTSLVVIVAAVFAVFAARSNITQAEAADIYSKVFAGWGLLTLMPVLSVYVKRLHDRQRSGWWLLFAFVPSLALAALWPFLSATGVVPPNSNAWFLVPFAPFFGWLAVAGLFPVLADLIGKLPALIAGPLLALVNIWLLIELCLLKGRHNAPAQLLVGDSQS